MSLKHLNLPRPWHRSSAKRPTDGVIATTHVQNPPQQGWTREKSTHNPCESGFVGLDFSRAHPCRGGFWTCGVAITPSVGHFAEERCYRSGRFKFFSDISRPLEGMAQCLELNWHFEGKKIFVPYSSEVWERLKWNEGNFCNFFFWQRSTV